MSEIRETADRQRNAVTIGKSLSSWVKKEQHRLRIERQLFTEHLRGDELAVAMRDNAVEQSQLDLGWKHSSLRQRIESRAAAGWSATGIERRSLAGTSAPPVMMTRATGTTTRTAVSLHGYGAVFDKPSLDLGGFIEYIERGAFTEAIKTSDVRCLLNHDYNHLLGRSTAATLELREDSHGLKFVCHLLDFDPLSYSVARRIDRRDVSGCSFSFSDVTDRWELARRPGDTDKRFITRIGKLYDVGPVVYPAYPQTTVAATFQEVQRSAPSPAVEPDPGEEFERWEESQFDLDYDRRNAPPTPERLREIGRQFRKAERILNRCRARTN